MRTSLVTLFTALVALHAHRAHAQRVYPYTPAPSTPSGQLACESHAQCGEGGVCQAGLCVTDAPKARDVLIVSGAVLAPLSFVVNGVVGLFGGYYVGGFFSSRPSGYEPGWEAFHGVGWIPVLGPWIQMGLKPGGLANDGWALFLSLDGLVQAAGWTLLIVGLTMDSGGEPIESPDFAVLPSVSPNSAGLTAVGRF
jgi:hypothetical protein